MADMEQFEAFTDGASRGNPGPSSAAFVLNSISPAGERTNLARKGTYIGRTTNNFAEYSALLYLLHKLGEDFDHIKELTIYSDSQLMVRQMTAAYQVKDETLQTLQREALSLIWAADLKVHFQHVAREHNREADAICNEVLDVKASNKDETFY